MPHYYQQDNANVHRGVHTLAERATHDYEASKRKSTRVYPCEETAEVLFTRGTTTSLNWVAKAMATAMSKQVMKS